MLRPTIDHPVVVLVAGSHVIRRRVLYWTVCVGEILLGTALLMGLRVLWVLLSTGTLLVGFSVALFALRRSGFDAGCGCFGQLDESRSVTVPLIRNGLLLFVVIWLSQIIQLTGYGYGPVWESGGGTVVIGTTVFAMLTMIYVSATRSLNILRGVTGR